MADRYPNRPFPADHYGRGGDQHGAGESDPLAELARLIGQTDPFGATSPRTTPVPQRPAPPREAYQPPQPQPQQHYQPSYEDEDTEPPPGPPQWIQRANLQRQADAPADFAQDDYADQQPDPVHPLHRYAAPAPVPENGHHQSAFDEPEPQPDPARYDDALYGQLESGPQDFQREPAYPDDPYAYQDDYEDEPEVAPRRRGGLFTVAAVLALAVVGTGAAFAYRTYVASPRSGDPPIIKADNTPTKVIPAPASDASGKTPDRMPSSDGSEKIVPREEAPVDVNAKAAGPRVVFPALNQNTNPPSAASVAPNTMPPVSTPGTAPNGTMPNSEPRKIKTLSVHGDQPDSAAAPVGAPSKPTAASRQVPPPAPTRAAAAGNAPLSLSPDSAQASVPAPAEPRTRMAATTPTQTAPTGNDAASAGEGRFLVQISSQTTEAEAQASFRALQKKFPEQLGSHSPVIKKADLGGKGVRYRAMVGPFGSHDEAARFCSNYKTAGGQCYVP